MFTDSSYVWVVIHISKTLPKGIVLTSAKGAICYKKVFILYYLSLSLFFLCPSLWSIFITHTLWHVNKWPLQCHLVVDLWTTMSFFVMFRVKKKKKKILKKGKKACFPPLEPSSNFCCPLLKPATLWTLHRRTPPLWTFCCDAEGLLFSLVWKPGPCPCFCETQSASLGSPTFHWSTSNMRTQTCIDQKGLALKFFPATSGAVVQWDVCLRRCIVVENKACTVLVAQWLYA